MCRWMFVFVAGLSITTVGIAKAGLIENFDGAPWPDGDQSTGAFVGLSSGDWYVRNRSFAPNNGVFNGNGEVFPAKESDNYAGMDLWATAGGGPNAIISLWLITPMLTFNNGDTFRFWTRTEEQSQRPDRLEVRMSTNGASVYLGEGGGMAGAQAVGDFGTLLQSVNPSLAVGGYYEQWTQVTLTIQGLDAPTSGRLAFRYFVVNAGPTGVNGNYIGIDGVEYAPLGVPGPSAALLLALLGCQSRRRRG